uniref:Uncharacterized protein n=1 Tax=Arundo donax TaxID=35708 RepID=A0A0A9C6G6_ARUDO
MTSPTPTGSMDAMSRGGGAEGSRGAFSPAGPPSLSSSFTPYLMRRSLTCCARVLRLPISAAMQWRAYSVVSRYHFLLRKTSLPLPRGSPLRRWPTSSTQSSMS